MSRRVLIVDDEAATRDAFARALRRHRVEAVGAADAAAALGELRRAPCDAAYVDLRLGESDGLELLARIAKESPTTLPFLMTGYGTYQTAVDALQRGALGILAKPVDFEEAAQHLLSLLDGRAPAVRGGTAAATPDAPPAPFPDAIVGESPGMKAVLELIRRVASTTSTVLITGDSGTGKELVARAIHRQSEETRRRRFVAVNCAAIPESLLESELFGYTRGAFTGAVSSKEGLLEAAGGGSILLDEIGEMSLGLQAKVLRAIEQKEIVRLGSHDPVPIRTRILCSTNKDLRQRVDGGQFREDLYYRINVIEIRLPALAERREDIPPLVEHLIRKCNGELRSRYTGAEPDAVEALGAAEWKGNVRELENVIERAMILGDGDRVRLRDLPPALSGLPAPPVDADLRSTVRAFERRHLQAVIEKCGGQKPEAARRLGISLSSLYRKLEEPKRPATLDTPDPPAPGGDSD
ncbi:MAG: sigma-54-dependent Fis family transcriptional regulator [Planctomycetes bacterium]|nr:sigma-54-dependent Fis family transcriptional regulator [Planctomycetota bacterium]